jgi:hypothetical protein
VSSRGGDYVRIAAKVLGTFLMLLGLLYVTYLVTWPIVSTQPSVGLPGEVSTAGKIASAVYGLFFFLTFMVPLIVLRHELRKQKQKR